MEKEPTPWLAIVTRVVGIGALLALLVLALFGKSEVLAKGAPLPAVHGRDLDGQEVPALSAVTRAGQPVLVNVWATWCPPCRHELPVLAKVAGELSAQVTFVGLATPDSPVEDIRRTVARMGLPYPIVRADGATLARLHANVLPSTYLVDDKGVVQWSAVGELDEATLRRVLKEHVHVE